jgi:hypothetical protein
LTRLRIARARQAERGDYKRDQYLLADQNENSGRERQNTHHYGRDGGYVEERNDANQNQINREQEQTEIFLEVHDVCLSLGEVPLFHVRQRMSRKKSGLAAGRVRPSADRTGDDERRIARIAPMREITRFADYP